MISINTNINAPCCPCEIVDMTEGSTETILVQTDYDFPGFASTFGWSVTDVNPSLEEPDFYEPNWRAKLAEDSAYLTAEEITELEAFEKKVNCDHDGTDGSIDCPACGLDSIVFIDSAREYLEENDGKEAEDPGYFFGTHINY
jgi:hypothetical protein